MIRIKNLPLEFRGVTFGVTQKLVDGGRYIHVKSDSMVIEVSTSPWEPEKAILSHRLLGGVISSDLHMEDNARPVLLQLGEIYPGFISPEEMDMIIIVLDGAPYWDDS